jgi:hypothetical protein
MIQRFWKVVDWISRADTLWGIAGLILPAWAYVDMTTAGMATYEIILHTSAILVFSMGIAHLAREFFGYWGERKERMRVVEILRERQEAGDTTVLLVLVASAWYGNDKPEGTIQLWLWNAKFMRLKRAVKDGKLKGTLRDKMQSDADVADLIRYFSSRID